MTHLMYKQFFTKYGLKDETFLCITSNSVVAAVFFSLKYFGQISLKHFGHFSLRHFGQWKILVICLTFVSTLTSNSVFSVYFQTFWPKWLNFFGHFENVPVYDQKMTEKKNSCSLIVLWTFRDQLVILAKWSVIMLPFSLTNFCQWNFSNSTNWEGVESTILYFTWEICRLMVRDTKLADFQAIEWFVANMQHSVMFLWFWRVVAQMSHCLQHKWRKLSFFFALFPLFPSLASPTCKIHQFLHRFDLHHVCGKFGTCISSPGNL